MPRAALAYQLAAWTGPPMNARGGAPLTIAGLLQAQRSRGNRAVQRHLRRHTVAVSPPPSRRPSGDAPGVQRLSLDDLVPDAILDPIKSLVRQVTGFGSDVTSRSQAAASGAQAEADATAGTVQGETGAAVNAEVSSGESATAGAQSQSATAESSTNATTASGEAKAGQLEGALPEAEHATDPVKSAIEPAPGMDLSGDGRQAGAADTRSQPDGADGQAAGDGHRTMSAPPLDGTATPTVAPPQAAGPEAATDQPGARGEARAGRSASAPAANGVRPAPRTPHEMEQPGGGPPAPESAATWDCDAASILDKISSVRKSVIDGLTKVVKAVVPERVLEFAQQGIAKLQAAISAIKQKVEAAKKAVTEWVDDKLKPVRAAFDAAVKLASEKIDAAKRAVSEKVAKAMAWASEKWTALKTRVSTAVQGAIQWAKDGVSSLAQRARDLAGRFWDMLPDWIKGPLAGAGAALAAPIALAVKAGQTAATWIESKASWVKEKLKGAADTATKFLAEKYQKVRGFVVKVGEKIAKGVSWIKEKAVAVGKAVYKKLDQLSGGRLTRWREAAAKRFAELKGKVCAFTGAIAGPCVERFVPEPVGPGGKSFGRLTTKAEINVPIEGVPVKVSSGATVTIERTSKKYNVVLSGEGFAGVGVKLSPGGGGAGGGAGGAGGDTSGSVTVEGTLPNKLLAVMALGRGGGGAPGVPIPFGAKPPATSPASPDAKGGGGGGGGASASAEAGVKVNVTLTYTFDATADKTTCDGLGGLTAFLASQGAAALLPEPFSALAAAGGQAAFADKLTSAKMTYAETGSVSATGGPGSVSAKLEEGVSIESRTDEKGKSLTATLFQSLSGEGSLKFAPEGISLAKIGGSLGGRQELAITYNITQDNLDATFKQALTGSVTLSVFAGMTGGLPAPVRDRVQRILGCLPGANEATVSFELSQTVANLRALAMALDAELNKGSAATAEGVWNAISDFLKNPDNLIVQFSAKLVLTEKVLGVNVSASQGGTGGSVDVGISRGQEIVLCPPVRLEGGLRGAVGAVVRGATPGNALLCDEDELIRRFGNRRRDLNIDPDEDPVSFPRPDDPPILDTFRKIYNRLDSWNMYIRNNHPDLFPEFRRVFNLELKRQRWTDELKERAKLYKEQFRDISNTDPNRVRRDYEAYVLGTIQKEIDDENRAIAVWYLAQTGEPKTVDEIIEEVHGEGTELWRAAWRDAIIKVNRVLAELWPPAKASVQQWLDQQRAGHPGVDLSGSIGELDYIGSLATGYKGPPKQLIRFNPDKFDVDANLPAPPLAKYAIAIDHITPDRSRIFGRTTSITPLTQFSNETHAALGARVKGYDKSDPFDVAIDAPELPHQEWERRASERLYELRKHLDESTYVRMLGELSAGGYLKPDGKTVRTDLTQTQFNEMMAIMDRYEHGG